MGREIEHKYLVKEGSYRDMACNSVKIRQGYLCREPSRTVRVRIKGDHGFITIKGITTGDTRAEYEYEIPYGDALELLEMCEQPLLDKIRYIVDYDGMRWEVDEFYGARKGLVVAEIELESSDTEYRIPPFVGDNVTGNPAYYNSNL